MRHRIYQQMYHIYSTEDRFPIEPEKMINVMQGVKI